MRFASLGSGSQGNALLVEAGDTRVLLDCGFAVKSTTERLPRLEVTPEQIDAWKQVTAAVHANGGRIFMQIFHTGRIALPELLPDNAQPALALLAEA